MGKGLIVGHPRVLNPCRAVIHMSHLTGLNGLALTKESRNGMWQKLQHPFFYSLDTWS